MIFPQDGATAVRDPQTIDTIARSGDGVLLLALTEDRPYTAESAAAQIPQ